jgi:hypothetical protein
LYIIIMVASIAYALLTFMVTVTPVIGANPIVALNVTTLSSTRLPKPISDGTAVLQTKVIYLHGGCDSRQGNQFNNISGRFECGSVSNSSYAFSLSDLSFSKLPDMPTPRYRHAAVALQSQIVLVGGRSLSDELIATVDVRSDPMDDHVPVHLLLWSCALILFCIRSTIFPRNYGPPTT